MPVKTRKPSARKRAAASANGAKAKGRKTPAGKARSALNATKHGVLANTVILSTESREIYDALRANYIARYQPADPIELDYVEEMVICKWRQRRLWDVEGATIDLELSRQSDELDIKYEELSPDVRTALAFEEAFDQVSKFSRYESRLSFQFHRARKALIETQKTRQQPNMPNEANPTGEHPAAGGSAGLQPGFITSSRDRLPKAESPRSNGPVPVPARPWQASYSTPLPGN